MKKFILLSAFCVFLFSACNDDPFNEDVYPLIGVYDANIVGVSGPFVISVTAAGGDDINIDAPWDGENWDVIETDVDNSFEYEIELDIRNRDYLEEGEIDGVGVFVDYTIQFDYSIKVDGEREDYTLIATKR